DEIYLEHFGLMDDDEYRDNCFRKLDEYRINGIYPGKNLIMTFESSQNPLDIKGIRMMIKDIFCS
ncbi:MAG: ATPase, partial [Oscillospiraceae bacterium]|nr:ATPase [Oscillospiraceae bacterium]